jgi:hypothetical protein
MKEVLFAVAAAALLAACGNSVTAPDAGPTSLTAAPAANVSSNDVVIMCDPAVDPGCVPGPSGLPSCDNPNLLAHAAVQAITEVCSRVTGPKKKP